MCEVAMSDINNINQIMFIDDNELYERQVAFSHQLSHNLKQGKAHTNTYIDIKSSLIALKMSHT